MVAPQGSIFAAGTGAALGTFPMDEYDPPPVFARDVALFVRGDRLVAESLTSGSALWSFGGNGGFGQAPIVAGPVVYIGSRAGTLYAIELKSGRMLWSDNAGTGFLASERQLSGTYTWAGLGAGNGLLVAPAGARVSAYSPPQRDPVPTAGGDGAPSPASTEGAPAVGTPAATSAPSSDAAGKSCSPSPQLRGRIRVTAGIRAGVATLRSDLLRNGRYVHAIRWKVAPGYRHPLTLTARDFTFTQGKVMRLRSRGRAAAARRMTTLALLPGPGCYEVGIKGPGLRREVVFEAR